jgi:hypothetical protein
MQLVDNYTFLKFNRIPSSGGRIVLRRQTERRWTDRRDETIRRISRMCERAYKWSVYENSFLTATSQYSECGINDKYL